MTPSHVRYRAAPRPDLASDSRRSPPVLQLDRAAEARPSPLELRSERGEMVADPPQRRGIRGFPHAQLELLGPLAGLREQALLRSLQGEAFVVEQGLDALDQI